MLLFLDSICPDPRRRCEKNPGRFFAMYAMAEKINLGGWFRVRQTQREVGGGGKCHISQSSSSVTDNARRFPFERTANYPIGIAIANTKCRDLKMSAATRSRVDNPPSLASPPARENFETKLFNELFMGFRKALSPRQLISVCDYTDG